MHESPFRILVSDLAGQSRCSSIRERSQVSSRSCWTWPGRMALVECEVRLDAASARDRGDRARFGLPNGHDLQSVSGRNRGGGLDALLPGLPAGGPPYRRRGDEDEEQLLTMDSHGWIDLESPIRDEVGLALPLKPLCRDDCLGLCPTCGTDLNTEPCEGHEDLSSSPFAVLEQFLDPQD